MLFRARSLGQSGIAQRIFIRTAKGKHKGIMARTPQARTHLVPVDAPLAPATSNTMMWSRPQVGSMSEGGGY